MRTWGSVLIAFGVLMTLVSFMLETGVDTLGGGAVNNIGLLQRQMMVLQTGLASFIAGCILATNAQPAEQSRSYAAVARSEETAEQRHERIEGVRRLNRIVGITLIGLTVLVILLILANL